MNKQRYLAELQRLLVFMTRADREETVRRYGVLFDQAGPGGEEELVQRIGSPTRAAIRLSREYEPGRIVDEFIADVPDPSPAAEPAPREEEKSPAAPQAVPEGETKAAAAPKAEEPPAVPLSPLMDEALEDALLDQELPFLNDLDDLQLELPGMDAITIDEGPLPQPPASVPEAPAEAEEPAPVGPEKEAPAPAAPKKKARKKAPAPAPEEAAPEAEGEEAPVPPAEPKAEEKAEEKKPEKGAEAPAPDAPAQEPPRKKKPSGQEEKILPRFIAMSVEQMGEEPPEEEPVYTVERSLPLWAGIILFSLSVLLLAIPLGLVLLALSLVFLAPGLVVLLGAWLLLVGGLWCISYIADAVMLFGAAFIVLGLGLLVLCGGLWLAVILIKLYIRGLRAVKDLTLGRKVEEDA